MNEHLAVRRRARMQKLLLGMFIVLVVLVVIAVVPVAVIAFSARASPPAMVSMATSSRQNDLDYPAPQQFQARDGSAFKYYVYPAGSDRVAVLAHGSAFAATSVHALAKSLRTAGVTVYVPDIRGHGGSGKLGDIDYVGQIDDDLADFVARLGPVASGEIARLSGSPPGPGSPFALPVAPMVRCLTAMCFFPRFFLGHQPCAQAPAVGPIFPSRA